MTAQKMRAKGEYCIFVDSDDWISTDLIKEALFLTEGGTIDIVNYSLQNVDGNKTTDWSYTVPEGIYEEEQMKFVYSRMMFDFEEGLCIKPCFYQKGLQLQINAFIFTGYDRTPCIIPKTKMFLIKCVVFRNI